jgi:hypothetical protein
VLDLGQQLGELGAERLVVEVDRNGCAGHGLYSTCQVDTVNLPAVTCSFGIVGVKWGTRESPAWRLLRRALMEHPALATGTAQVRVAPEA